MESSEVQQPNALHSRISPPPRVEEPLKTPPSSLEDHTDLRPGLPFEEEERGIGVAVRVRPLSTAELANSTLGNCIHCLKESIIIGGSSSPNVSAGSQAAKGLASSKMALKPRQFDVDAVYHQHASQKQVYEESCRHIVEGLFDGTNGAILAYGATGSGKTHTMFGGMMSAGGIVYQAAQDIFDEKIRLEEEERKQVEVKCSFVEIYNENVFDLLAPPRKHVVHGRSLSGTSTEMQQNGNTNHNDKIAQWVNGRPSLPIREGGKPSEDQCNPEPLQIPGLIYVFPKSVEEFAQAIERGRSNRFVACTAANAQSSRSHAIITIEVQVSGGLDYRGHPCPGTVARIRMCDLAGSERAASSSNSGIRLREGGNINRSLLALGSVVQSLLQRKQNNNKQKVFVPYRGSSLTRLLKDSIGGNCRTQMIFCLNPSTKQQEESINTMLFAMKARQVQVVAQRNEFSVNSAEIAKNQELLIDELRQKIVFYEEELQRAGISPQYDSKLFNTRLMTARFQHEEDLAEKEFKAAAELNNAAAVGLSSSTETSNDNHQDSQPQCFPSINLDGLDRGITATPLKTTTMRRRKSFTEDSSPMFVEQERKLKDLMGEKESQYWKNREAKERIVARDLQLRELNWKLAQFLASNELGVRIRGDPRTTSGGTIPTPVGVAGMRNTIAAVEDEQILESSEIQFMMEDIERIDRQIEAIRNEIPREKHSTVLELLFDNMKLRQNCTEAEHLASDYHQECRQTKGRINEYQEALSVCVSALHSVIPHLPHNSKAMADAKLALFFANLPDAKTENMLHVFEASLVADSTPPLVPSGLSSSPSKTRHPYCGDDQMQTIHDLEESFHTLTSSPPRRSQGLPLHMVSSLSPPELVDDADSISASEVAPAHFDSFTSAPNNDKDAESFPGENESSKPASSSGRGTSSAAGNGGSGVENRRKRGTVKEEQSEKEKEIPVPQDVKPSIKPAASVSKIAKATTSKLAPFTRFYSSLSHLQPTAGSGVTAGTTSSNTSGTSTSTAAAGTSATGATTSASGSALTASASAPASREHSGANSNTSVSHGAITSSSSSPSFSRASNTPTRRRMMENGSNSSSNNGCGGGGGGVTGTAGAKIGAEPRPVSPGGYARYPVSSPMRSRRPMDLAPSGAGRRSAPTTVQRNQASLRNGIANTGGSNKNVPSTIKHIPGSLVGESPPKRTSPHRLVHHSANHAVVVEEAPRRRHSPASKDPSRVWVRMRYGDTSNAGGTQAFQRTASNPQHPRAKPSTPPPAPPPPSIPGLASATPAPKVQAVIARRITKENRHRSDARAEGSGRAAAAIAAPDPFLDFSPVSERSTRSKTLPSAGSPRYQPPHLGTTPIMSALSIDDDMQVSRSTFSDLDELSSTMSQTPRDWVYRV